APAPAAGARVGAKRFADRMTELVSTSEPLGLGLVLTSLLVAALLGALHALGPGHGKTIVGAYLIGARGTARHALFLGLVVTTTTGIPTTTPRASCRTRSAGGASSRSACRGGSSPARRRWW